MLCSSSARGAVQEPLQPDITKRQYSLALVALCALCVWCFGMPAILSRKCCAVCLAIAYQQSWSSKPHIPGKNTELGDPDGRTDGQAREALKCAGPIKCTSPDDQTRLLSKRGGSPLRSAWPLTIKYSPTRRARPTQSVPRGKK